MIYEYYINTPNGPQYFQDLKEANTHAQELADKTGQSVGRYDTLGGLSLFRPSIKKTEPLSEETKRARRNKARRDRDQAKRDLGLRRAPGGAFGGWE